MDKNLMVIILFCIISVSVAYLFHKRVENYIFACIFAALISSVGYQIIGYLVLGYLDPFFLIALATSTGIAFFIAVLTGIPVAHNRRKKNAGSGGQGD
ncbi:MAG: hypothetical protein ACOZBW_12520 [Thermodesulfobacteriota bacterium]